MKTEEYLEKIAMLPTATANYYVMILRLNQDDMTQKQFAERYNFNQSVVSKTLSKLCRDNIVKVKGMTDTGERIYALEEEYNHYFSQDEREEIDRLLQLSNELTANCYRVLFVLFTKKRKYTQSEIVKKYNWNSGRISKVINKLLKMELIRPDLPSSHRVLKYEPNWERHISDGTIK